MCLFKIFLISKVRAEPNTKMKNIFEIILVITLLTKTVSSNFIYSNDTISLTLSSNTRNIVGLYSSR